MQVFTPVEVAKHAANKYLGVLVAAKYARMLNEFPRDRSRPGEKKLTTRSLEELSDGTIEYRVRSTAARPSSPPMRPFAGRRILLGVTGGIASYKSAWLARLLTEAGAEVDVVMTRAATEFVGAGHVRGAHRPAGAHGSLRGRATRSITSRSPRAQTRSSSRPPPPTFWRARRTGSRTTC